MAGQGTERGNKHNRKLFCISRLFLSPLVTVFVCCLVRCVLVGCFVVVVAPVSRRWCVLFLVHELAVGGRLGGAETGTRAGMAASLDTAVADDATSIGAPAEQ